MAENKEYIGVTRACFPARWVSCLTLVCALFALNACSALDFLEKGKDKTELEKKHDKMKEEISYLDEKKPKHKFNPKNMFGSSLRSDEERIDRLERAVQDMRNEFESVKPSIKRLTALEGDIQRLVHELKQINDEEDYTPATSSYKAPQKKAASRTYTPAKSTAKSSYQKKSPPASNGKASVYDVRVGEHPGRTRIVMDVSAKTKFSVDIDNSENIMIIELPNAGWSTSNSKNFAKSNFISSYKVESSNGGHILILQLKRNAKVTYKGDLAGKGSSRRLVIDLQGA